MRGSSSDQNLTILRSIVNLTIDSLRLCTLWQTLREGLYDDSRDEQILSAVTTIERFHRRLVTLLPRGKGAFPKESAETSINSYCQGQAAPKKNIICLNGIWPVIIGREVWLSVAPLEKDGWLVVDFDHYCDPTVSKRSLEVANLLSRGKQVRKKFARTWRWCSICFLT